MMFKRVKPVFRGLKMLFHSLILRRNLFANRVYFAAIPRISRKNSVVFSGHDIYIGYDCHFGANVVFGSKVLLASNVSFVGGDHCWDVVGTPVMDSGRAQLKTVSIGDDVWVGHGAIIMQGVTLGEGCIVAAGSVVIRDVEPYAIVGGNPATEIKKRFDTEQISMHRSGLNSVCGRGGHTGV